MTNPYTETDEQLKETHRRVHANGEQTHLTIVTAGDSYAAVAYDIDPAEVEPVASECIAYDPTIEGVRERALRWMQANPRGVAGEGSGGSVVSTIMGFLKRMDDYGNQQVEQVQDQPEQ